jgi:hypothetical protein
MLDCNDFESNWGLLEGGKASSELKRARRVERVREK